MKFGNNRHRGFRKVIRNCRRTDGEMDDDQRIRSPELSAPMNWKRYFLLQA